MATKPIPLGQCKLIDARLSFPKLFTPESSVKDGPLKFGANFLIAPLEDAGDRKDYYEQNMAAAQAAYDEVFKAQWKEKKIAIKDDRKCYREGEKFVNQTSGEVYAGYDGIMVVTAARGAAKSKNPEDSSHKAKRPPMFYRNKDKVDEDDGTFFAGCRVDAVLHFYSVTDPDKGGNGIFATIEAIRFRRDDIPFGAPPVGADAFDDLPDDEESDDGFI